MKIEIKKRGLRIDGKGWVYGDLINYSHTEKKILESNFRQWDILEGGYDVIPESVGQFIGLSKGKREVYQDDVFFDEIEFDEGDKRIFYIVTWIAERCAFALLQPMEREVYDEQGIEGIKENFEGFYYEITQDCIDKSHYKGNIHENPELLNY